MSACRITVYCSHNRYFLVCCLLVLFLRGTANILAVNTCMRHLKPLQFIGLVSADAAWLSESSVCTHTQRWSFWRHGNTYRADAPRKGRRKELNLHLFPLLLLLFFSSCFSLACLTPPTDAQCLRRLCCFPRLPQWQTPSSWDLWGKLSFKISQRCFFTNNL